MCLRFRNIVLTGLASQHPTSTMGWVSVCLMTNFLGILLVLNYCSAQCFLNPSTTTSPQDGVYRTDVLDLKHMTLSLLEYVSIIRSEYWSSFGPNLTLTAPSDGACAILGNGQSLQTFTRKNNWEVHLSSIPILTDVLQLAPDKFYIPHSPAQQHRSQ